MTVQPDGKILVYGNNLTANGGSQSIARLNRDGIAESSFSYYDSAFSINSAVVQSDGKIIVAGSIFVSSTGFNGALVRRLNSNGTVDSTFTEYYLAPTPSPGQFYATVWASQADDRIIISIKTTAFGMESYDVRRLNRNGGLDNTLTTIQVSAGGLQTVSYISKVVLQADEKILVSSRPAISTTAPSSSVRRYLQNGTPDSTFTAPQVSSTVTYTNLNDVIAGADGGIVIGGSFQQVNSVARNNLAKLQATGNLDTSFTSPLAVGATNGNSGDEVRRIAFTSNNQIIVSTANRFLKLNSNGTIDDTFTSPNTLTQVNVWRIDSTDRIVFIGTVVENGSPVTRLRRLNTDGSFDTSFSVRHSPYDFDGDGRADVSVFRPSNATWYLLNSATGFNGFQFGIAADKLVPADYDGDGKTDVAVFRSGTWYLQRSTMGFTGIQFGNADDIPVPADYDGDGKTDVAVFRPSNATWYLLNSAAGFSAVTFGSGTDKPVPGDYNGDGRAEVAVFRPSNGYWYTANNPATSYGSVQFGTNGDKATPADYDGDGKTDIAVFRPSNGTWYLLRSTAGFAGIQFGLGTDLPVAADYDGDGKADVAVFRNGTWYLQRSTQGFTGISFGAGDDKPIPASFVP
ncbi:MAG: FG-GAP-like repeat-containing protein [Acidobacteriota bacterium]|nr:FG-GAP-like repeat-containing protein [Acidobacteriota bacterium]